MRIFTTTVFLLCLAGLSACGGGGGDSSAGPGGPGNPPPVGGIGRTGFASGPITTFGSIVVNGVRYETDNAEILIDDSAASEDDLKVGQVVTIEGTVNDDDVTGSADRVVFDEEVKGPVTSIDTTLNRLVVLGQTVQISGETSFDDSINPASIEGLSVGDIVEVSGLFDANGTINATRIELKPAGTLLEVHGTVSNLDGAAFTFNLNSLVVDYSAATLRDFPGGQISDGDFVEAKGSSLGSNGELLASEVEFEDDLQLAGIEQVEIEGFITRFVSAEDFDVGGFPVTTTAGTAFEGGVAADLGLNIKIEVEGSVDATGLLVATKVDIRQAKAVRATALIDSVDAAGDSLELLGITVTTNALTRFEDKSDADVRPLTIDDLNAGDYVAVRGDEFPAGSGQIRAALLEREDVDDETELQGFVESVTNPSFAILGVTIETGAGTVFRDENDAVIGSAEFFARLASGSLVKAEGTETAATVITATEVEFEIE